MITRRRIKLKAAGAWHGAKDFVTRWWKIAVIVTVVLFIAGWLYATFTGRVLPVSESVTATQAPEINNDLWKVDVMPLKPIQARAGQPIKRKLNLPEPMVQNKDVVVLDAVLIPEDGRRHTVTPTLNTATGAIETMVRKEPLPWFKYSTKGAATVGYGVTDVGIAVRLGARQEFACVKMLCLGATATVDQPVAPLNGMGAVMDTRFFVGVTGEIRWQ